MTTGKEIAAETFPADSRLARVILPQNIWILENKKTLEDYRNSGMALLRGMGGLGASGVSDVLLFRRWKKRKTR